MMVPPAEKRVSVLQCASVAPSYGTAEARFPLTFFDAVWVLFHPVQRLLFFSYPISSQEFLRTVVPSLVSSLSRALSSYIPLAGNLIFPLDLDPPELLYSPGDFVPITFTEAHRSLDFNHLTAQQPRDADAFYDLVPDLPTTGMDPGLRFWKTGVLALQVTVFPETGICIGFTSHHAVGDASALVSFVKAWSSETKLGRNRFQAPVIDRSVVTDPSRRRLHLFWNQLKASGASMPQPQLPTQKLRATFVLQKSDVQLLKNRALANNPITKHVSSFTVVLAHSWVSWVKSAAESGETIDENEPEYLGLAVEVRNRVDPPLPEEYFGNCLAIVATESTHGKLKSEDAFFEAVNLIGECISEKVNKKEELMKDADEWLVKIGPLLRKRIFGVAGSPRFNWYDADFGWGVAKRTELASIDGDQSISMSKSPEFEGGIEIGLSATEKKMKAYAGWFSDVSGTQKSLPGPTNIELP